jgi:hypothetical protein
MIAAGAPICECNESPTDRLISMTVYGDHVMKKLVLAGALVLAATSASFAQYAYGPGFGYRYYDAAPGYGTYGAAPGYGYYASPPAWFENNTQRGGPGPRVGAGSGMGAGSQR